MGNWLSISKKSSEYTLDAFNGRLVRDEKVLRGNFIIRVSSNMGWCLGQKPWCKQPRRGEGPVQVQSRKVLKNLLEVMMTSNINRKTRQQITEVLTTKSQCKRIIVIPNRGCDFVPLVLVFYDKPRNCDPTTKTPILCED